jgi:hypothetical protein
VNVAIVGCGLIGRKRAQALGSSRLVACADAVLGRAEALAREYPGCTATDEYQRAIEHPEVQAVVVAATNNMLAPVGLAAIEAGADDVQVEGETVEITAEPASFEDVRKAVEGLGVPIENAELTMQPKQTVTVGEDKAAAVLRLLEALEEEDDVQQVYANFDIPADVLERVSASV